MAVRIILEDDNAALVASWISYLLFSTQDLPDYAGTAFSPLMEQIESQVSIMSVLDPANEIIDFHANRQGEEV